MANFDDLKLAVEALSGGMNTVKLDDLGMPSILVPFPKLKYSDVITDGTQDALPAFIVDGQEKNVLYMSKYQNIIVNDRAYSLPMKDPATSLNFDRALTVCRNKGQGWHLTTNAFWAAVALWCKKNATMPHGNNNFGQDTAYPYEKGVGTYFDNTGKAYRTAAGSGPATWYHNYNLSGIADLNGNVWEWVAGLRLQDGEIQVIPYGNAMKHSCNMSATSTEWKAIMPDGSFVDPGTAGTLKWDYVANKITLATTITMSANIERGTEFESIVSASGLTVPSVLKSLGIFPDGTGYGGDFLCLYNTGERYPLRGGCSYSAEAAGVFALGLSDPRSVNGSTVSFRSAFYE